MTFQESPTEHQQELFGAASASRVEPFLKWAGGKRQLLRELLPRVPKRFNRYYEPFLGSGALYFALRPTEARLSDSNSELICTYEQVRNNPEQVIELLEGHKNDRTHFNRVRATDPSTLSNAERAARLIYLNRTCFNGLYRVNQRGEFNTPFGSYKNPNIRNSDAILAASAALQEAQLNAWDYSAAVEGAVEGDFIYLDPPYVPVSQYSDFKRYSSQPFGMADHEKLQRLFGDLMNRGCFVMLSNSCTPETLDLYSRWHVHQVFARRLINKNANGRSPIQEILVTSYAS